MAPEHDPKMCEQRRLKERGAFGQEDIRYKVSKYAAKITLSALTEMFKNAREAMEWLGHCAKLIAEHGVPAGLEHSLSSQLSVS